jgi:hypothetical protein
MSARSETTRVALVLLLAMPATSCVDYLNHRDSVTLAAGDSLHANAAIQTINPWPYSSREKYVLYDGQYVKKRIDVYASPSAAAGSGCVVGCTTINNSAGGSAAGGGAAAGAAGAAGY